MNEVKPRRETAKASSESLAGGLWYLADRFAEDEAEAQAFVEEAMRNWQKGFQPPQD